MARRRQPGDAPAGWARGEVADRLRRLAALTGPDEAEGTHRLADAIEAGRVPVAVTTPDRRTVLVRPDGRTVELVDHRADRHPLDPRSGWRPVDGTPREPDGGPDRQRP